MGVIEADCCSGISGLVTPEHALSLAMGMKTGDLPITLASLQSARGMILATDVFARGDVPPFASCAMDGYAVATNDLVGDGPWQLPVAGQCYAGEAAGKLPKHAAIRVLTGAALPERADCVIMEEAAERDGDVIRFISMPRARHNVRPCGSDLAAGDCVLQVGRVLGPREIAAAAAAGQGALAVRTRLPVALVSTGSELCEAGFPLDPGHIWNVNLPMLGALASHRWIDLLAQLNLPDRLDLLVETLRDVSETARLVVTSGGAAGGDADFVAEAIGLAGGQAQTLRLAMKPGKPLVLGRIGEAIIIGLPGNPVSAYVAWMVIALPLARHLAGALEPRLRPCWGTLARSLQRIAGRREYRPARIVGHDLSGHPVLELVPKDFSSRIALLASMDGFAVLPEQASHLAAGEEVGFLPFEMP